jgi:hypothetical protein
LTELCGEEKARETRIELGGATVRLKLLYGELERLTGRFGLWDVVQKLMLEARRREGIRPNTGVPLPTLPTQGNRAAFPWLEEGSGTRRQPADDGAWCG